MEGDKVSPKWTVDERTENFVFYAAGEWSRVDVKYHSKDERGDLSTITEDVDVAASVINGIKQEHVVARRKVTEGHSDGSKITETYLSSDIQNKDLKETLQKLPDYVLEVLGFPKPKVRLPDEILERLIMHEVHSNKSVNRSTLADKYDLDEEDVGKYLMKLLKEGKVSADTKIEDLRDSPQGSESPS